MTSFLKEGEQLLNFISILMPAKYNKNKCLFGPKTQRYWDRRYDLFLRFDEGIEIDEAGLYSVTPEKIALEQAETLKCKTALDGFCGVGGNAISFARTGKKVFAIERNKARLEMARHNAELYGVQNKIAFILGDIFDEALKIKADGVFIDPDWGGPEYKKLKKFKLSNFSPDGNKILKLCFKHFSKVALKVPDIFDFNELEKYKRKYEIQNNIINGEVGFKTVYFGLE
jgi:trimethylguanosine synthase